jgi:nucleoside-diphosphate-sugar epimerase
MVMTVTDIDTDWRIAMRIFVTGASGFIGSAVVAELTRAGHEVVGLARSDHAAAAVASAGADVHRGSLEDFESLRRGAEASDGVIHTAFIHDFSQIEKSGPVDVRAIETMGEALAGSGRPLVIASAIGLLEPGHVRTEGDAPDPNGPGGHRAASELAAKSLAFRGVRSAIVRLAPSVHGEGDHAFVPALVDIARTKGVSGYIGDGSNRWAAVHRLDAARLFRLAFESAPAGSVLHGVSEEGVPTREIAEVIGRHLDVPVVSVSPDDAAEHFTWLARFFGTDMAASSAQTQQRLGWHPEHPELIADLDEGHYFDRARAAGVR